MDDKNLKIAFLSTSYKAKSEVWIWKQIQYLKPFIAFIGVQQSVNYGTHEKIPLINLLEPQNIFKRILDKIKNKNLKTYQLKRNILSAEKRYPFNAFYIHYLTQAYELRKVLLKSKKRIFIHCHGYDVSWSLRSLKFPFNNVYDKSYIGFALEIQNKAIFIANSNFTKKNLLSIGINKARIKVLKFGVGTAVSSKKKMGSSKIRYFYLGRLVDCKGPHLTIEAFNMVCDMGLNAELIIAGDGPLMTTCRLLRNKSKYKRKIKILGEISSERVEALFKICHIFTAHNITGELTHQTEAYGVSILEAMANGLPVVTGRSGGVVETVKDGKCGYLFSPGNIKEHAKKLFELGSNNELRERMGNFAIEYVQNNFSSEAEKRKLFDILDISS